MQSRRVNSLSLQGCKFAHVDLNYQHMCLVVYPVATSEAIAGLTWALWRSPSHYDVVMPLHCFTVTMKL